MSRLSEWMRRYRDSYIVETLVTYLEHIDLPGDTKKKIVMSIVRALHTKTGGKWDAQLERAVSGAIEWVLATVRKAAEEFDDDSLGVGVGTNTANTDANQQPSLEDPF